MCMHMHWKSDDVLIATMTMIITMSEAIKVRINNHNRQRTVKYGTKKRTNVQ